MIPHATPNRAKQADNPTRVILDNGCTKTMGSWYTVGSGYAVERFFKAIEQSISSPDEVRVDLVQHKVDWTLRLLFNTLPPIDVLEQGQVPISRGIDQMRNRHVRV